jgi:phage shock protein A
MGLLGRIKGIWYAILNSFVSGLEDKYVIELAESQLAQATERLKEGRQGLTLYQALVYKVQQQVEDGRRRAARLTAEIKAHLKTGNEQVAGQLALELSQVKQDLAANEEQLKLHQQAYENNLLKMKTALRDIEKSRGELEKRKAALKMERALAEVAEAAGALNTQFDVSTDFSRIMSRLDDQINQAKARSKVASDLSGEGVEQIKARQDAEQAMARELLEQFKVEEGLASPGPSRAAEKTVGPAEAQGQPEKTLGPSRQADKQPERS